jgi:hypothetical protein
MPTRALMLAFVLAAGAGSASSPGQAPQPAAPLAPATQVTVKKWTGDLDEMIKRRRIRVLVGVMQLMPATGKDMNVGDIHQIEANINAGVKYMRFMIDQYFKNEPMDRLNKGLFTFASYNAGPGRIRQLRAEAKRTGLDPNVWFDNVERVAAARIGCETVQYVSNIYRYCVAYQLAYAEKHPSGRRP